MKLIIGSLGVFLSFVLIAFVDYKIAITKGDLIEIIIKNWYAFPIMIFCAPFIWYGYRCIYTATGDNVWLTSMINSVIAYLAFNTGIYFASGKIPTKFQLIALILNFVSIFIASL